MKILRVLALLSFILLSDCKKDSQENYFAYDGKTYSIAGGKIYYNGGNASDGYHYQLRLYSTGITFEPGHANPLGSGELLYFVVSSYTQQLQSRKYVYNVTPNPFAPGTYSSCWLQHNLIVSAGSCENIELYTGTLYIGLKETSDYRIYFDIKTRNGKPITGYYEGYISQD
jgi:hypothetical protein